MFLAHCNDMCKINDHIWACLLDFYSLGLHLLSDHQVCGNGFGSGTSQTQPCGEKRKIKEHLSQVHRLPSVGLQTQVQISLRCWNKLFRRVALSKYLRTFIMMLNFFGIKKKPVYTDVLIYGFPERTIIIRLNSFSIFIFKHDLMKYK